MPDLRDFDAQESRHREREERYWDWSIRLTALGTIAAVIAALFAVAAFLQYRRQADAAFAQNRPWIQVEAMRITSIKRGDGFVEADIIGLLKNHGHSVATDVVMHPNIQLYGAYDPTKSPVEKVKCLLAKDITASGGGDRYGGVSFPDEENAFQKLTRVSIADMRERYNLMDSSSNIPQSFEDFVKSAPLEIFGCLTYVANGLELHGTGFDFIFDRADIGKIGVAQVKIDGVANFKAFQYAD